MCGIAGYLATEGTRPDRALLKRMCDRLAHRGPDAYGQFIDGCVALGHRRLSIVDLSGGSQPMGNEDGSLQVVFNGEIYNYLELRDELIARGHRFATNSDTEVLVHLYEDFGERMPEHLNGMFAFAIWDSRRRELFLARDRMGEKPLYYGEYAGAARFWFASELKAATLLPGFNARINRAGVSDFLCLSYVPDPDSIYEGASKLRAGHSLTVSRAGVRVRRYWQPPFVSGARVNAAEAVEQVRALCSDSVKRRMIGDVPLGAFLSGGVDSSAVAGMMSPHAHGSVKTFSIGFDDPRFDELPYARMVAERYRTDHHEETVTPSIHGVLDSLVGAFDEPFGDSSAVPMLYLSRMTRRHVTVALSGDGADELFGGYRRYAYGVLEQRLRDRFPTWFRRTAFQFGGRYYPKFDYLPQVFRAKSLLANLARELGSAYFHSLSAFGDAALQRILPPDLRRELGGYSTRERLLGEFAAVSHLDPLKQMQAVDMQTYLPGDILVKTDRTTMAYSLEGRAPWLDHRLVELACGLPSGLHLHGRTGKYVFRQAVDHYLPEAILTRRKMGFSVPLASWFRTGLRTVFECAVLRPEMEEFCSLTEVRRLWREHRSGLHNHDRKLWLLLMLSCWEARHRSANGGTLLSEIAARLRPVEEVLA